MGRIGQEVAQRLAGWNAQLVYFDPMRLSAERERELGVRYVGLDDLLRMSDAVTIHVPLNERTRNLIDAESLSLMKPSAVLVNTARGGLVDEDALAQALREGRILGAGLDVLSQEPPPLDHPLAPPVQRGPDAPHRGPNLGIVPAPLRQLLRQHRARPARGEAALGRRRARRSVRVTILGGMTVATHDGGSMPAVVTLPEGGRGPGPGGAAGDLLG